MSIKDIIDGITVFDLLEGTNHYITGIGHDGNGYYSLEIFKHDLFYTFLVKDPENKLIGYGTVDPYQEIQEFKESIRNKFSLEP